MDFPKTTIYCVLGIDKQQYMLYNVNTFEKNKGGNAYV